MPLLFAFSLAEKHIMYTSRMCSAHLLVPLCLYIWVESWHCCGPQLDSCAWPSSCTRGRTHWTTLRTPWSPPSSMRNLWMWVVVTPVVLAYIAFHLCICGVTTSCLVSCRSSSSMSRTYWEPQLTSRASLKSGRWRRLSWIRGEGGFWLCAENRQVIFILHYTRT